MKQIVPCSTIPLGCLTWPLLFFFDYYPHRLRSYNLTWRSSDTLHASVSYRWEQIFGLFSEIVMINTCTYPCNVTVNKVIAMTKDILNLDQTCAQLRWYKVCIGRLANTLHASASYHYERLFGLLINALIHLCNVPVNELIAMINEILNLDQINV